MNSFFIMMYISSFFTLMSCNDWFMVWLSLEINMFSFLLIISNSVNNSIESGVKYFFIQSLGSSLLMLSFYSHSSIEEIVNMLVLSYKMGAGPFYFWFPMVCDTISWGSCFLLMSAQKVMPLVLISMYNSFMIWFIIFVSMIVGVWGIINQINLKRLLAFSSIHHIGWMLVCNCIYDYGWVNYLLLYTVLLLSVVVILIKYEGLSFIFLNKVHEKFLLMLSLLSMGGMPPMLGFFLKWWVFYYLMGVDAFLFIFMIMMSVLVLYYYVRIVFSFLYGEMAFISWKKMSFKSLILSSYEGLFLVGTFMGPLMSLFFLF